MKNLKIEIKWAVIYFLMTTAWALLGKVLGFHSSKIGCNFIFNTLILIPSFIIYYLAIREKRNLFYHGTMTFKRGLTSGMLLTIFVTIFGALSTIVTTSIISPDLFKNSIHYAVDSKMMTEPDAARQFTMSSFIITGLIAAPVFGLVFSIIAAAILRRK